MFLLYTHYPSLVKLKSDAAAFVRKSLARNPGSRGKGTENQDERKVEAFFARMMESFITNYGYWAVLVGTFLEGETILVLGGFAAYQGYLALPWVILAAFLGSFCGDQFFFFLGRKYSARILAKRPSWQSQVNRVNKLMDRFRTWLILMFRFMYGLRTVTPFVIGMSPIPRGRFILLNGIGALAWAIAIGTAGYFFGHVMEIFLGEIKHYEIEILAVIVSVGLIIGVIHFFYRRRAISSSSSVTKKH